MTSRETESGRGDEWEGDPTVPNLRLTEYKCQKCGIRCTAKDDGITLIKTVKACFWRDKLGPNECGLKQMANFVQRMSNLQSGKPDEKVPWVLKNPEKVVMLPPPKERPMEFEVEVPNPIRIMINKKGNVTVIDGS